VPQEHGAEGVACVVCVGCVWGEASSGWMRAVGLGICWG